MAETTELFYFGNGSDKFYRATLDGHVVTFTWGRRGTNGQTQTHDVGLWDVGLWAARNLYEEKIAETLDMLFGIDTDLVRPRRLTTIGDVEKLMDKLITKMVTAMVETEGA